jgi:hypothetical protein
LLILFLLIEPPYLNKPSDSKSSFLVDLVGDILYFLPLKVISISPKEVNLLNSGLLVV